MNINNTEDKKNIKAALQEISNSKTRVEAERDLQKDIVNKISEEYGMDKKVLNQLANIHHKQNISEVEQNHKDVTLIYEALNSVSGDTNDV